MKRNVLKHLKRLLLLTIAACMFMSDNAWIASTGLFALPEISQAAAEAAIVPQAGTNELDGSKIEGIKLQWVTPDSQLTAEGAPVPESELYDMSHLYLSTNTNDELVMIYRIEAQFSGQYDYKPGDVTISIPAQVWPTRAFDENGVGVVNTTVLQGGLELPVPEAPSTKADFNWQQIGDQYVLTNTRTLNAASSVSIEIAIRGLTPMDVVDMSTCNDITAHCEVLTNQGNIISLRSTPINAQIDTTAEISYVHKDGRLYAKPDDVPDEILAKLPAGAAPSDYIYVMWHTYQSHKNNQPYSLQIEDVLSDAYELIPDGNGGTIRQEVTQGIFLGSLNYPGTVLNRGGLDFIAPVVGNCDDYTTEIQYGKTVYMWSAYKKSDFTVPEMDEPERVYYLDNEVIWVLIEADGTVEIPQWDSEDPQKVTRRSDSVSLRYSPMKWRIPPGSFIVNKWTEQVNHKDWDYGLALNLLEQGQEVDMNFVVETVGYGYPWTSEYTLTQRPAPSEEALEDSYGRLGWKQVTDDYMTFFNYENVELTSEDFEFKALRITEPALTRYQELENGSYGYYQDNDNLHVPTLRIEVRVDGGDWQTAAHIEHANDKFSCQPISGNPLNVSWDPTTDSIFFSDNVTDVRWSYVSNVSAEGEGEEKCELGGVVWYVYPTITLKPSERVQGVVAALFDETESPVTKFKNDVQMDAYGWVEDGLDDTAHLVAHWADASRATLAGAGYGVELEKEATYSGDPENKQVLIHYTITLTEQSNLADLEEYLEAVEIGAIPAETSGVWYDLLPPHVIPRTDSVKLREGDSAKNVYAIENYKNSGRYLLVVEADLTPVPEHDGEYAPYYDAPTMEFDAAYTVDDMDKFGADLINYAAFESTVEELRFDTLGTIDGQRGEPDDPTGGNNATTPAIEADVLDVLKDLDPATDENRFVYAKVPHTVTALHYTVLSLEKEVRNNLGGNWTHGLDGQAQVTVYEGHPYTYKISTVTNENTAAKDIILYDTLENYIIPDPNAEEDTDATKAADYQHVQERKDWSGTWNGKGQWRGSLECVDLSEFVEAGIDVVLLYATTPGLQFAETKSESMDGNYEEDTIILASGNYDVSNRAIWTVAGLDEDGVWTVPDGVNVSALAIDARKDVNGNEFILMPKGRLTAYLRMRAPDDDSDPDKWNAKGAYARMADDPDTVDWEAAQDPENNMYAFNNTRMRSVEGDVNGNVINWQSTPRMIRDDYTRVGLVPSVLSVKKLWEDQDNHDGLRPDEVKVSVLRKAAGSADAAAPVLDADGKALVLTLNEANDWAALLLQMDVVNADGVPYLYTFEEEPVEGYRTQVNQAGPGAYEIRNIHPNEMVDLSGRKIWSDDNDAAGKRPATVNVCLYRDGQLIQKRVIATNGSDAWEYSFGELEKYRAGGGEYEYRIEEEYVPKYASEIDEEFNITNTFHPIGDLRVQKIVNGATSAADGKEFAFTLVLLEEKTDENAADMPLMDKYPGVVYDSEGNVVSDEKLYGNGDTFILKAGQYILFTGLPSESRYEIIESANAGYTSASENASGVIMGGGNCVEATFTNTYSASGSTQLKVGKTLTGAVIQKNRFKFELVDMNPGSETYGEVISTARVQRPEEAATGGAGTGEPITSEAEAPFSTLRYTAADHGKTFLYEIREADEGLAGYKNDEKSFQVEVYVADNGDGTMTATPIFVNGGDEPKFENVYSAEGSVELKVWKILENHELQGNDFEFELYEATADGATVGQAIATATNDASGNVVFDAITFNQDDLSADAANPAVYYYLAKEKTGADETVIYSAQQYLFKLTVLDNGDGTLSFEQETYAVEEGAASDSQMVPVFTNQLKPGALTVEKLVSDDSTGGDADQEFTFHVKLSGTAAEDLDFTLTVPETPDDGGDGEEEEEETEPSAPALPPFVATQRVEPKAAKAAVVLPSKELLPPKDVVKTNYVHATDAQFKGDAYAVLDTATKTMTLFRSEDGKDLQGNAMGFTGDEMRVENTEKGLIYYKVDEEVTKAYGGDWPWYNDRLGITSVKMEGYIRPSTTSNFFREFENVTSYDLSKFDTSQCQNVQYMFYENSSIESIDISGFDTGNAENFCSMFRGCSALKSIDLSSLDLSKATDISLLLAYCTSLTSVEGMRHLHTENVRTFGRMFLRCSGLTSIDLSSLDTSSATMLNGMFSECKNLTDIDVAYLKTNNCIDMSELFQDCVKLEKLDLRTFDTAKVTNMANMFDGCTNLKELDLSSFNTAKVTNMSGMFQGCKALENLDLSTFDTAKVKNMSSMFRNYVSDTALDLSNFNTASVTDMSSMFYYCDVPEDPDLRTFDTSKVTNMKYMFGSYTPVKKLDISFFDTSSVTDMSYMFHSFGYQDELDLRNFNTSKVTKMQSMFQYCRVSSFILSSFDTSNVTSMQAMFYGCGAATGMSLDLSNFTLNKCTSIVQMFSSASRLAYLDISGFDTVSSGLSVNDSNAFSGCSGLKTVVIGSNAKFNKSYPVASTTLPYDGRWMQKDDSTQVLTSAVLFTEGNHAGTWVWNEATYKLNFLPGDEGSGAMASVTPGAGQAYTFVPKFTSAMYEITGFVDGAGKVYTLNADGTCTIPENSYAADAEVTLTAQWQKKSSGVTVTEDGVTFKLKAGGTITFNNLPAGTTYEVWEELPTGWVLVSKSNDVGEIEPLKTAEAVFTNKYDPTSVTLDLRARKLLDGEAAEDGKFTFTLSDESGVLQTKQNAAGGAVTFDTLTYKTAGVYTYTIAETAGTDATIEYDETKYTVTVTVTDDNSGNLSATVAYARGTEAITAEDVVFANETLPGSLKVSKIITGAETEAAKKKEFTIEIAFTDEAMQPWSGEVEIGGEKQIVSEGKMTVTLQGGESVTLEKIPAGLRYEVVETGEMTGWTLSDEQGTSGQIAADQTSEAAITNDYSLIGSALISISKELEGREQKAGEFTFQLVDENGNVLGEATNNAGGTVNFEAISYTKEGTYTYYIAEVEGEDEAIGYSTEKIRATVVAEDAEGNGKLKCTVTCEVQGADGAWAEGSTITNTVRTGALSLTKVVESVNDAHKNGYQFNLSITLTNPDGSPYTGYVYEDPALSSGVQVEGGVISGPLSHNETISFYGIPVGTSYKVTEEAAKGFTATYEGEVGSIEENTVSEATVTNTYEAKGEYVFEARKSLVDGNGAPLTLEAGQFTFEVMNEDGEIITATNDADGKVVFEALSYDESDVGEHTYVLYERNEGKAGYEYSEDVHTILVTVTDNGDGTLSATAPFTGDDYTFENRFSNETSVSVEKIWEDDENKLGVRPGSVTVQLYQNRQEMEGKTAELNEANKWQYTFEKLPAVDEEGAEYSYEVREQPVEMYQSSSKTADGKTTITNRLNTQGALEITKTVVGGDETKEFTFTLTLTQDGKAVAERQLIVEKDGAYTTVKTDAEGAISFTLKHGEKIEVQGLPYGAEYRVEEAAETGYKVECNQAEASFAQETVKPGTLHQAAFTNTYEANGETQFSGTKTLTGKALEEKQFSFELIGADGQTIETVQNAADGSFAFAALKYGIADVGKTYTYTVKEVKGDLSGVTYDETEYTVTVEITDNGDGTLTAKASDNATALNFTNTYEAAGETQFSGTKTLTGKALEASQFSFELIGADGQTIETVQNAADGSFAFAALKYGIADVGKTYTYTVKEVKGDLSGVTYDETEYTVTVEVTDNGDGTLTAKASDNAMALNFTNTYEAAGETQFSGTKTLTGKALEASQFSFELIGADGQTIETVQNAADGSFAFAALKYGIADVNKTYTYTVKEVKGDLSGVTYDETEYTVTVEVTDNGDGTLKVEASDNATALNFTNTYEATGKAEFSGVKTLEGRTLAEGEFSFELLDANGTVLETVRSAADGKISFTALEYVYNAQTSDLGEHTYTVKEVPGSLGGVTYDETEYTVTVEVTDNGDGTLTVKASDNATALNFKNIYEAGTTVQFSGKKTLEGREFKAGDEFLFELVENGTVVQRSRIVPESGKEAAFTFNPIEYVVKDVGTHTYIVREAKGQIPGVTYDETEYTITVEVVDDGKGSLIATQTIEAEGQKTDEVVFANIYEATGELALTAVKTVNGGAPAENQVFSFTLSDENGEIETVENKLGEITFSTLNYTLADLGTHTYTVKENAVDAEAYTADDTVYTIEVEITDNGDGTLKVVSKTTAGGEAVEKMAFENAYRAKLTISKTVAGCETEETFTIRVWFYDAEGNDLEGEFAYTGDVSGTLTSGQSLELGHKQTAEFVLPVGTSYKVEEAADPRFTTTINTLPMNIAEGEITEGGNTAAYVNTLITTDFAVWKEWRGGEGGKIVLTLYANGEKLDPQPEYDNSGMLYKYTNLPKYDENGDLIVYSAKEKYMDGYLTIYMNVSPYDEVTNVIHDGGTIINKAVMDFKVQKVWVGLKEGEEAPAITLVLYCNGEVYDYPTPTPDAEGWYFYNDLPVFVNDERAVYSVVEEPTDGCIATYTNGEEEGECAYNGGVITNKIVPKTGDSAPLALWSAALLLAVAGMLAMKKKKAKA